MTDLYEEDRKKEFLDLVRNPENNNSTYHGDSRVDIAYYPPLVFTPERDREISSFTRGLSSILMRMLFDPEIQDFYPRSGLNEVLLQLQKDNQTVINNQPISFGFRFDFMQDQNSFYLIEINAVNYCAMCDITPPTRALLRIHPELNKFFGYRDVVQSKIDHLGKFGRNVGIVWHTTEAKGKLKEAEPEEFENQYFLDQAEDLDISVISSDTAKHIKLDKDDRLSYNDTIFDSTWIRYPATLSSVLNAIDFVEKLYRTATPIHDHPRNMLLEDRNLLAMLCNREFVERYCNNPEKIMSHVPNTTKLSPDLIPMIRANPDAFVVKMSDLHAGKGVYVADDLKDFLDYLDGKTRKEDKPNLAYASEDLGRYFLQQRIASYELDVEAISGKNGRAITDFAVYASGFHDLPSGNTYTKVDGYLSRFQFKGNRMITNISQGGGVIPVLVSRT